MNADTDFNEPEDEAKENEPLPFGQNLLGITYISDDFDEPLPEDVLQDFGL
jgi:hypothetical protein